MRKILLPLALASALTTGLVGCSSESVVGFGIEQGENAFDLNDIMFAQMMIPHHEQAVELAGFASTRTSNPDVIDLASRIAEAQQPEIDLMASWLTETGSDKEMGHAMHMPGVVSDADMDAIRSAQGPEFDALFLTHMIAHHEGAIDMANDVLGTTENPEVKALAEEIIATQTAEIAEMKALLAG